MYLWEIRIFRKTEISIPSGSTRMEDVIGTEVICDL